MSLSDIQKLAAAGELDFLSKPPSTPRSPRRLPSLPRERPVSVSRPLPPAPHSLACKKCRTNVTSISLLLPLEAIPPNSRAFRGFSGKASLFTEMSNVRLSPPKVRLMATGAHTMQEINCAKCAGYLGWKINRAHERSEVWKEGHYLLELENLHATRLEVAIPRSPPLPRMRRHVSSDSEDSTLSS
ncbi:yippee zinc-binding protein moh1 [Moniliophthora roreri MCA 2997]|uniref:Yippee zinc-binding protein moh1 n=2 Tax=Moniliophthora roreri TaxID=221103 RepID=V2XXD3_MONRO|nr:yippee zinc-binding protein moh1 [Moniliophthora roreri MCA 2997]